MKTMPGYRVIASYVPHGDRFYHAADTQHQGPSVNRAAFYRGERPAPLVEMYAAPEVGRLVVERQHALTTGQVPTAPPPPPPSREGLACPHCHCILCRCTMPPPGGLAAIVALQRAQGRRE